jgi:menaquinone-specific isochorismate synthase
MTFENTQTSILYASQLTLIKKGAEVTAIFNPHLASSDQDFFHDAVSVETQNSSSVQLAPDFADWTTMLNSALELFETSELEKVVLKRNKVLAFENQIAPLDLFKKVYSKDSDSYNIYVQSDAHHAFISLTPEKLFSLTDSSQIETISLAGSVPRGDTKTNDQDLEAELLHSPKLIREQLIVTQEICHRLQNIADTIKLSDLSVMKLKYIQHRANIITAKLSKDRNFIDLINCLHPTPAVGGYPTSLACSTIANLEQGQRHNYAAPIGFASFNYSEWAVGLRSASVDFNTVTIYSGCGIVSGSTPEIEWNETENKMQPFANIFLTEDLHV